MAPFAQRIAALKQQSVSIQNTDGTDLAQQRRQNDLHLRGTLDSIYEKYSRDFSEVGDEVNILTGEVIVNRGHVQRMRGELDIGTGQVAGPRRSWINDLVHHEPEEERDDDEDELGICPPRLQNAAQASPREVSQAVLHSTEVVSRSFLKYKNTIAN